MMPLATYLAFVAASTALILLPGPNVALIVGTSLAHGPRKGLATVAGTSSAMVMQLTATYLGLAVALTAAAHLFAVLRWVGILYLLGLGLRALTAKPEPSSAPIASRSTLRAYMTGFAVSLTNPKTLLFYGAFLPQFLDPARDPLAQLLLLSGTFLGLAITFDCAWVFTAGRMRGLLSSRPRLGARLAGASLIGAALGLALVHERN